MFQLHSSYHQAVYVRSITGIFIPVAYIRLKLISGRYFGLTYRYMNITHKKVYTIYKVLYKIKQLKYNFKKSTLEMLTKATVLSQLRSGSRQHVWETVIGEMVSGYFVLSDVSDKLCIASIVSGILRY